MNERASGRRQAMSPRSLESIPAFRKHLEREGLTVAEWEARNGASAQADDEMLRLQARYRKVAPRTP